MAARNDALVAQPVDQLQGSRHLLDRVAIFDRVLRARARIVHDHGDSLASAANCRPRNGRRRPARHQEQRRSAAMRFVVELCIVARLSVALQLSSVDMTCHCQARQLL